MANQEYWPCLRGDRIMFERQTGMLPVEITFCYLIMLSLVKFLFFFPQNNNNKDINLLMINWRHYNVCIFFGLFLTGVEKTKPSKNCIHIINKLFSFSFFTAVFLLTFLDPRIRWVNQLVFNIDVGVDAALWDPWKYGYQLYSHYPGFVLWMVTFWLFLLCLGFD